jgi:hypothetical protein
VASKYYFKPRSESLGSDAHLMLIDEYRLEWQLSGASMLKSVAAIEHRPYVAQLDLKARLVL